LFAANGRVLPLRAVFDEREIKEGNQLVARTLGSLSAPHRVPARAGTPQRHGSRARGSRAPAKRQHDPRPLRHLARGASEGRPGAAAARRQPAVPRRPVAPLRGGREAGVDPPRVGRGRGAVHENGLHEVASGDDEARRAGSPLPADCSVRSRGRLPRHWRLDASCRGVRYSCQATLSF
jgi:hypothetical protein